MKRILQVIESAYRGTLEEQDDTVVWLTLTLKGAGAEPTVVLRGHAVNYAVLAQDASGLAFGDRRQTCPPRLQDEVARLLDKGVPVHLVREDLEERGIPGTALLPGVRLLPASEIAELCAAHELVWWW